MGAASYYYEILGVSPSATIEEVKKAYHALVRRNHPDLFTDERKRLQGLKMVQINEAYARIMSDRTPLPAAGPDSGRNGIYVKPRSGCDVGFCNDIEYAYYKQGFENYSTALHGIALMERKSAHRNEWYYIQRFSNALCYLRKADTYFSRLLEEFPESIWAYDAWIKVRRIEYFSRLYRKILKNMDRRLREKKRSVPAGK
ncbi:MAG: DnaJ domain-containing protein [Spirochaetes bacterium]|nr:DnaJ domain-containing protein [Spirochaetota bacterium]